MTAADELKQPVGDEMGDDQDERDRRSALGWLPWVAFVAILLLVAWLIWNYTDFGAKDPGTETTVTEQVTAAVPDVVGLEDSVAVARVEAAGFVVKSRSTYESDDPAGVVSSQEPIGGVQAIKGSVVLLLVSSGLGTGGSESATEDAGNRVPDVTGLPEGTAKAALERAGFVASISRVRTDVAPSGLVFYQNPLAGDYSESGATVQITVSLGKATKQTRMPDVMGLSESAARAAIVDAGLSPRPMYQPNLKSIGKVYDQSPDPGATVNVDTKVFYLVGVNP